MKKETCLSDIFLYSETLTRMVSRIKITTSTWRIADNWHSFAQSLTLKAKDKWDKNKTSMQMWFGRRRITACLMIEHFFFDILILSVQLVWKLDVKLPFMVPSPLKCSSSDWLPLSCNSRRYSSTLSSRKSSSVFRNCSQSHISKWI